jgi:hypothetical protein
LAGGSSRRVEQTGGGNAKLSRRDYDQSEARVRTGLRRLKNSSYELYDRLSCLVAVKRSVPFAGNRNMLCVRAGGNLLCTTTPANIGHPGILLVTECEYRRFNRKKNPVK